MCELIQGNYHLNMRIVTIIILLTHDFVEIHYVKNIIYISFLYYSAHLGIFRIHVISLSYVQQIPLNELRTYFFTTQLTFHPGFCGEQF